jgi:hypothetical protein
MNAGLLQLIAVLAASLIVLSTLAALLWGVWTYKGNGEVQVQLLALGALQHYLDLALAHPDMASRDESKPVDAQYAWFAAQALNTAQTLWIVVGRQANWQRSIHAIVRQHRAFPRSDAFLSNDFSPEFVNYLREGVTDLKCAQASDAK